MEGKTVQFNILNIFESAKRYSQGKTNDLKIGEIT